MHGWQKMTEQNTAVYELRLNELTEEFSRVATEYYACLSTAGGATNNDDTPGQGGANKTKVRNDLKPKELNRDFTPMERTTWMRSFRHFFRASNMEKSPAQEQQANLLVCVEASIATEIVGSVDKNTPVYRPQNAKQFSCTSTPYSKGDVTSHNSGKTGEKQCHSSFCV